MRVLLPHAFPLPLARRPRSAFLIVSKAAIIRRWSSTSTTRTGEPLRILFCGSDEFSCSSLQALNLERHSNPGLVASIDVVTRPGKRTGRGLKDIKEMPIKKVADDLGLITHERDTFTGWTPPVDFNLIVAVSFGLFVPPRILGAAKYGGLNVHPSLLPDLPGASPIQHAILHQYTQTGVTLQTLDPHAFDQGRIVAQEPLSLAPGATTPLLVSMLGHIGAQLLVNSLRQGLHLREDPPKTSASPDKGNSVPISPINRAPRLTKADAEVPWPSIERHDGKFSHARAIEARFRALGPLWTHVYLWKKGKRATEPKRVVLGNISVVQRPPTLDPTQPLLADREKLRGQLYEGKMVKGDWWRCEFASRDETTSETTLLPQRKGVTDEDGGVVLLFPGQEALRVGHIKIEGKDFLPAADVMRKFAELSVLPKSSSQ